MALYSLLGLENIADGAVVVHQAPCAVLPAVELHAVLLGKLCVGVGAAHCVEVDALEHTGVPENLRSKRRGGSWMVSHESEWGCAQHTWGKRSNRVGRVPLVM